MLIQESWCTTLKLACGIIVMVGGVPSAQRVSKLSFEIPHSALVNINPSGDFAWRQQHGITAGRGWPGSAHDMLKALDVLNVRMKSGDVRIKVKCFLGLTNKLISKIATRVDIYCHNFGPWRALHFMIGANLTLSRQKMFQNEHLCPPTLWNQTIRVSNRLNVKLQFICPAQKLYL